MSENSYDYERPLSLSSDDSDMGAIGIVPSNYTLSEGINMPPSPENDGISYEITAVTGCNVVDEDAISFECDLAFEEYRFSRDAEERSMGITATQLDDLRHFNNMSLPDAAMGYAEMGWVVTPLTPETKEAYTSGWEKPFYSLNVRNVWKNKSDANIGGVLAPSNLCTVDIDNKSAFMTVISKIGDDLVEKSGADKSFLSTQTAGIKSCREGHGKLVFKTPSGLVLTRKALNWSKIDGTKKKSECVFELRGGWGFYDALPPSIHPDTHQPYQWVGTDAGCTIADMPADLLYLWEHWDEYLPVMKRIDPNYKEEVKPLAQFSTNRGKYTGRSFIDEWNCYQQLPQMLLDYGYVDCGNLQYARPDSRSKNPDTKVNVRGGKVTFYAFSTSDFFHDGHQHTPFDLKMHFDFDDDFQATKDFVKEQMLKVWGGE